MKKTILIKTFGITTIICLVISLIYSQTKPVMPVVLGQIIGLVALAICLCLMYFTVYKPKYAWVFYITRVSLMFGIILISIPIKQIDSLVLILPFIISLFVLTIITAIQK